MAESIWEKGRLTAVYQQVGRRESDRARRFRRANFDVLEWASVEGQPEALYILPNSGDRATAADYNLKEQAENAGREFGYYTLDPMVVEVHEADGRSDSWKALHAFGPL